MLIVLSPAKKLDYESPLPEVPTTLPPFTEQSAELIDILRDYSPQDLAHLMKLSDKLAELNVGRYLAWSPEFTETNSRPAVFAFSGDVYTGLQADSLEREDLDFAQQHLRILSGLYGILRPLDLMQPYRLEMGTRLPTPYGKDLYQYWGDKLAAQLSQELQRQGDNVLVNLASNEYFKAIDNKALEAEVISPVFKDYKNGQYKVISFFAKKARGAMARWIIDNRITEASDLRDFDSDGYRYDAASSTPQAPVFLRDSGD